MTTAHIAGPFVRLERDYPHIDWDAYRVRENIQRAQRAVAERTPARYRHATVSNQDIADWVRRLINLAVESHGETPAIRSGPSLLVLGATGTGKTHQIYAAATAASTAGLSCSWKFTTAADIYARLRPRTGVDPETLFQHYATVPLLLLDDLGAAKATEWTEEINYRLINHRYSHAMPTLITSNVPPRALGDTLGERVASRLTEMTQRVVLTGEDRRTSTETSEPVPLPVSPVDIAEPAPPAVADPAHVRRAITEVAHRLGWRTERTTPQPALAVDCPYCHALAGRPCTRQIPAGHRRGEYVKISNPHPSRTELAHQVRR